MYGSELPPIVDQKAYAEMTKEELEQEVTQLQLQMQDPNLTEMNTIALQEQLLYAGNALQAKQNSMAQLQGYLVPVLAGYALTHYLVKNPEVQNKNLAYAGGIGLAYFLHHLISK